MDPSARTNYDLMYGSEERAAELLALDVQRAMIEAVPNMLIGTTSTEEEISSRIDARTIWQVRLVASTRDAVRAWALEFMGAAPGEHSETAA